MSQKHVPDRARKYKEDPAPVASQTMVSRLFFPAPTTCPRPASPAPEPDRPFCLDHCEERVRRCRPSSFLLHAAAAAASASRVHQRPVTPAAAPLCLHGMPFPPSSPATQTRLPCRTSRCFPCRFTPVRCLLSPTARQRNPCHLESFRSHRSELSTSQLVALPS
jgi:hypothetical protein